MKPSTRLVHFDASPGDSLRPTATPIYQTATFEQDSATEFGAYDYSRSGNPTRTVLEQHIARMENGTRAFCFASGMAAIVAVTRLLRPGDEILATNELYGGTCRFFTRILAPMGIDVRYADAADLKSFWAAIGPRTRLIHVESPTNPTLRVIDIRGVADLALRSGALLCVDNSLMSPYLQNPLDLGADIVVHSGTKFLCGHSDVVAGAVVVKDRHLADRLYLIQNGEGAGLGPDAYLLLRGMKTMGIRIDRQQASARRIVDYLMSHPIVTRVYYPGLIRKVAHASVHERQARGPGAVLSFQTGSPDLSRRIVELTRLFAITVSFGGVISSISLPARMSHASVPESLRASVNVSDDLVRLSVGIEDVDDLIEDLGQAFEAASVGRRLRHASVT